MKNTVISATFAFLWALSLGVFLFVAMGGFSRADQYIKAQIIHDCSQDYLSQTTNEETGKTVIRPLEQQVRECIWQKGVHSGWEGVWSKE